MGKRITSAAAAVNENGDVAAAAGNTDAPAMRTDISDAVSFPVSFIFMVLLWYRYFIP